MFILSLIVPGGYELYIWKITGKQPLEQLFITRLSNLFRNRRKLNLFQIYCIEANNYNEREIEPLEYGISYYPNELLIAIPLTTIGYPFFKLGLKSLNYGALGTYLATSMWLAFDLEGGTINSEKEKENWYTEKSKEDFQKFINCFKRNTENIEEEKVEKLIKVEQTSRQSIADLIGFEISLITYHRLYEQKVEKRLPNFKNVNKIQLFTMSFANLLCETATNDYIEDRIMNSPIAPNSARVTAVTTLSNNFSEIWYCPRQSSEQRKMKDCEIWN